MKNKVFNFIRIKYYLLLGLMVFPVLANAQKNVLFIAVDDLKPLMGCYGSEVVKTPHIDKLAREGFVFKNNHCQQAVCAPSRASILTGKRPDYTRIWDLKTFIRDKNPDILTMPQYFRQLGFQTAAVGKVFDKRSVDNQHDSLSWTQPYTDAKGSNVKGGGYVFEKKRVSTEAPVVEDSLTMDGSVVKSSNNLLDQFANSGEPFFLAVGFFKPHLPFVAPKKYWDMYNREDIKLPPFQEKAAGAPDYAFQPGWEVRSQYIDVPKDYNVAIPVEKQLELIHGYYACVSFIDQQIANVINHLDELGLRENTVIVLWGDHGWHLGDHDMWCKHTNFEQATRSPLIISSSKKMIGSTIAPTEFVDVFPTLCELAKVKTPDNLDGLSLVPLMKGKEDEVKPVAVSQFARWPEKMGYSFRDQRYRYTVWMTKNFRSDQPYDASLIDAEELYDYEKDPLETRNFVNDPEYADVKKMMVAKSKNYFKEQQK
ncbi:sulfatase [Labilibacter sediminis]|nr:sulfatase [Labilibacter sediminis]